MIQQQHESFQKLSNSGDGDSNRNSRPEGVLVRPPSHSSAIPHSEIVKDPAYRTSFAMRERLSNWCLSCFQCCSNSETSFVNTLDQIQRRGNTASISQDLKKIVQDNKILKLKILETSRLQLDANVMHPFVKVHVVNKNTGCYIKNQEKTEDPVVYHKEELNNYNRIEKKYESTQNDMILPFATACCDFRKLGNSKGIWNQKFYINYPAHLLLNPDIVFLFEILDFNHQALLYRNDDEEFDRNNMFRVAWSFLRPVGISRTHLGKIQLQLFRYKYNASENEPTLNKSFIPDVYYDFIWNNHEKYQGYLQVQLNYCSRPRFRFIGEDVPCPTNYFEEEQPDRGYLNRYASDQMDERLEQKPKASKDLFKFFRNRGICEVPKQLIYKLQSQNLGCFRVKFLGNYLLAACSRRKTTIIKVFDLGSGQHVMNLKGHRGIIYQMQTSANQSLLATAGSDLIVRIWSFPRHTGQFIDQDQSQEFVIADLVHSAAVYSVSLVHQTVSEHLFVLTCCYDGYLRLWNCDLKNRIAQKKQQIFMNDGTRSADRRVYPTASAVCSNNFFVVGDSIGQIRIFDLKTEKATLDQRCIIKPQEMTNDVILNIQVLNKNHLMIQASDNLIRHFDLIGNKLRLSQSYSGGVFEKELVQCSISPDNKYLMSPNQLGKPLLWDVFTGTQIPLDHLNLNVRGNLVCCEWHPRYNLVAVSGFFDNCPVFVFGNVLGQAQIKLVTAQIN